MYEWTSILPNHQYYIEKSSINYNGVILCSHLHSVTGMKLDLSKIPMLYMTVQIMTNTVHVGVQAESPKAIVSVVNIQ